MTTDLILKTNVEINLAATEVWEALTDPEVLKKTLFGCDVVTDWKEGSPILFKGSWDGHSFVDRGTILTYKEGKSYEYNYWSNFSGLPDQPENYSIIKFELSEANGTTKLSLEQRSFATQSMYEHSIKNWEVALSSLKKLIER